MRQFLEVDVKDIEKFEDDLKAFNSKAFPFASKSTLNSAAFKGREIWQRNISQDFTLRNQFTRGSVRVEQTRTLNTRRQEAVLGSVAPYMEKAEFGGVERKSGKVGVAIPTATASGEGDVATPRQRLPRGANKLARIKLLQNRPKGRSRMQRNVAAIKQAIRLKKKYVFLDFEKHPGIYKIVGRRGHERIRLLYDLSNDLIRIPADPTLAPSIKETQLHIPTLYRDALVFQLRRLGLFYGS